MKRWIAAFMLLILLSGLALSARAEVSVLYESDFSKGEDGWYTVGTDEVHAKGKKTLEARGRTENWNGPRRDFELVPGETYYISVDVVQNQVASARFMVSVAHSRNGGTVTYENLIIADAQKGQWTTLAGEYTPGNYDQFTLYVETVDQPALSYEIRAFSVRTGYSVADRFMEIYNKQYAPKNAKTISAMKAMALPDFMTAPGSELSSWPLEEDMPEIASVKELTLEDKVLTITLDRKVDHIDIVEYTKQGSVLASYYSDDDRKNRQAGIVASMKTKYPKVNRVVVAVKEWRIRAGKKTFSSEQYFELDAKTMTLNPTSTRIGVSSTAEAFPPYTSKTRYDNYITRLADGSVSGISYSFDGDAYLSVEVEFDEEGQVETCTTNRFGITWDYSYNADVRLGRDRKIQEIRIAPDNELSFVIFPLTSEYFSYYRDVIRQRYPKVNLYDPEVTVWDSVFWIGGSDCEHFFVTKDDLFILGEDGTVRYNENARDINGDPFQDAAVMQLLDPGIYNVPLY